MVQADRDAQRADGPGVGLLPDQLVHQLDERLTLEQVEARLPSLVAGLARDGRLLWWGARGTGGLPGGNSASTSTQYRIGSISKTFTAVMIMRLRNEGALALNDSVGQHLAELSDLPVTVGQLLSHTSGLRAEPRGPWWERTPGAPFADLVSWSARPSDLWWRPGRRFHYSNVGFAILGELAARKRSAPFAAVVHDELLVPLRMTQTTQRPVAPHAEGLAVHPHADLFLREPEHDAVAMAPAGQLWSTMDDLVIWSEVLAGHRPEVLDAGSVAEMAEPIGIFDIPGQPWTAAYGLGLQIWNNGGQSRYGHTGAMPGHWAMLLVDEATKDVALGLANSTYQGHRPEFFNDLLSLLGSGQPRAREAFRAQGWDDVGYRELLGTWYWGPVEFSVSLGSDGRLQLKGARPGRDCRLRPDGNGSYVGESGYFDGEHLEVHRRDDGSVSHFEIATFVFTRSPYDPGAAIPGGVDDRAWDAL
jgi:CubicO group peptidase (beta-lactamase class C family)